MIQLDILARFANTYFAHRIDQHVETMNYQAIERNYLLGALPWSLSRLIPRLLALAFGGGLVENVVAVLNGDLKWLGDGLSVAGAVLPSSRFCYFTTLFTSQETFSISDFRFYDHCFISNVVLKFPVAWHECRKCRQRFASNL